MKLTCKASTGIMLLLLGIGGLAILLAFQALTGSVAVAMMLFGVFFITYTAALLYYLHLRDQARTMKTRAEPSSDMPSDELKGTLYGLRPGRPYRVVRPFTDFYGNPFQENEILHFKERHFLPYHGGHTLLFAEKTLYLQEEENKEFIGNFSEYIVEVPSQHE